MTRATRRLSARKVETIRKPGYHADVKDFTSSLTNPVLAVGVHLPHSWKTA